MTTSIIPVKLVRENKLREIRKPGLIDKFARVIILRLLSNLEKGKITLTDRDRELSFGEKTRDFPFHAKIDVHDARFYRKALFGGSIGAGEAYMAGYWATDDLTNVIRIVTANQNVMNDMDKGWARVSEPFNNIFHHLRRNTRAGSRENIKAHYDLGNDFYQLFLDPTMTYSSGIFDNEKSTMEEASLAKYERLCRKLALKPNDHILEIGSGWGGFAVYAAENFGCRVTTTTISNRQYKFARRRISDAGLDDRITLLKKDYRDLEGEFEKIISIEMIEAVGHQFFEKFFQKCSSLLKPNGILAIQTITIVDYAFNQYKNSVDFIRRYIFPGGCVPSISALNHASAKATDMKLFHLEDITPHYAETIRRWRKRFFANIEKVRSLGYSETFIRMWEFYLSYCEAGFMERYIGDVQMIFTKPLNRSEPILTPVPPEGEHTRERIWE